MSRRIFSLLFLLSIRALLAQPSGPIRTVFVILMENHTWADVGGNPAAPYINGTLLPMGSHALQYRNPPGVHPSLPNYLWLEAGTDFGIQDDHAPRINQQQTAAHLVTLLRNAGISWKSYQESIPGDVCPLEKVGELYDPKHNPMVYFTDVTGGHNPNDPYCLAHVRPYSELAADLANNTVTQYNFITPNLCNDMHGPAGLLPQSNCDVGTGDQWLAAEVPKILASRAYQDAGAIFLTWDEADEGDDPIGMIVLSRFAKNGYGNDVPYTHGSMLRSLQEIFGVGPMLGDAATQFDLSDLFRVPITGSPAPLIVSAATLLPGPIAPGQIISILGAGLGPLNPEAMAIDPATHRAVTELAGARVWFDGVAAPLLYAQERQINAVVPFGIAAGATSVQFEYQGRKTAAQRMPVAPASPGIFTMTQSGQGQGAILNQDSTVNSRANPAAPGSIVALFATGAGQTDPASMDGSFPSDTLPVPLLPVTVEIGGRNAQITYAGAAPLAIAGLLQVNAVVPAGVSGDAVPIVLKAGDRSSPAGVTLAIR